MAKQLWKQGTGNYPNNVVTYLLNSSPMYYVEIPKDTKELRLLWESVTRTLPAFVKDIVQLVFDEQFTLKQTAVKMNTSITTTRGIIKRLYSWVNKDGYAMQVLFNWAVQRGYVTTITQDSVLEAQKLYMAEADISAVQALMFFQMLQNGCTIYDARKQLGVRLGILIRLYNKALEVQKEKDKTRVKRERGKK